METQTKILDIAYNILRHWLVILITAVVFALSSFLYTTYCITELYYSRGSLYVNSTSQKTGDDIIYQEMITSQELIYTYIEVLKSDHFMDLVAEKSGLNYNGKAIKKMVSMSSLNNTEIMEISVLTPNPKVSQKLIQTILDNASEEMTRVIQGGSIHVVDNASFSSAPSSPNVKRNTALGFLLGAILCVVIIYYRDVFDSRIKSEFDCKNFNLPVLGEIPIIEHKNVQ